MPKGLTKKMGPLPIWAWGLIFGVVGYYLYERNKSSSTSSTSPTASVLDPNAVDPNTGLTYGQEEDAALNANAAQLAGTSGGGLGGSDTSSAPPSSNLQTGTNELGDLSNFLSGFGTIASQLGYTAPGAGIPSGNGAGGAQTGPGINASTSGSVANGTIPLPALTARGAIRGPSGPKKPPPVSGYKVKGLGSGNWEYVPVRRGRTQRPRPSLTTTQPRPRRSTTQPTTQRRTYTAPGRRRRRR